MCPAERWGISVSMGDWWDRLGQQNLGQGLEALPAEAFPARLIAAPHAMQSDQLHIMAPFRIDRTSSCRIRYQVQQRRNLTFRKARSITQVHCGH